MSQRLTLPRDASTAVRRFGLGPKPGEMARIGSDPRGAVLAALADPKAALLNNRPELQSSNAVFAALQDAQIEVAFLRAFADKGATPAATAAAIEKPGADAGMMAGPPSQPPTAALGGANPAGRLRREALRDETAARIERAVATATPILERLVYFWSNHFCVSVTKGPVRALAGAYEREAIRPHVLGRFSDMLAAVEQHPAMLIYLDNAQSIGPNSRAGLNRERGLNENLAREILELHTLGVDGGYAQTDVTNFARILTGWTVGQGDMIAEADKGRFIFTPNRHEPGAFTILGKSYDQPGQQAGLAVLADLARHPSTARHIARKLARHFVADVPPPMLVAKLEKAFRDSDGDLAVVSATLVEQPEGWDAPAAKIVPPFDFLIQLVRGFELQVPPAEIARLSGVLGQPMWQVGSPKGWPDADNSWMGPSPLRERLRIAEKFTRDHKGTRDPRVVLADLAGAAVSAHTTQAVARAETREQAFELMMMSPDFMRR